MRASGSVCSRKSERWDKDMALDHDVVGIGVGSSALLVGPMIFRKARDAGYWALFFVRSFSLLGKQGDG